MTKIFAGVLIGIALVGVVLGVTGWVHAQGPQQGQQPGYGTGMMGGRGAGMMGWAYDGDQTGPMHDLMMAAWAEKLGLSVEDIEASLAAGETLSDLAVAQGWTLDEFQTARVEIHTAVLDEAAEQGLITQEQADWMKTRFMRMGAGGCTGYGYGGRGRRGALTPQTNP